MEKRKYTLAISGVVKFDDTDAQIENLLLGGWGEDKDRIEVALQELGEQAEGLQVKMDPVEED